MLENVNLKKKLTREGVREDAAGAAAAAVRPGEGVLGPQIASMVVFEGWDAAGKGDHDRDADAAAGSARVQALFDRRPRTYEQQRPWLWRFWLQGPEPRRDGDLRP